METGSPIIQKIKELRNLAKLAEEKEWEEILSKFDPMTEKNDKLQEHISFIINELFRVCVKENSFYYAFSLKELILDKRYKELENYSSVNKNRFIKLCAENIVAELGRKDSLLRITTSCDTTYFHVGISISWNISPSSQSLPHLIPLKSFHSDK
jgi:hypothetical protein